MENSQAAEMAHETELRKRAAENKMKEGFNSMEAVALLDADDLGQS